MKLEVTKPNRHYKGWGWEDWIHNSSDYCGKILHFNKAAKFSLHAHCLKKESWYVLSGVFLLKYIDTDNAEVHFIDFKAGDIITVERMVPHQLITETGGDILEISTQHFENDSYRFEKGDSQEKGEKLYANEIVESLISVNKIVESVI